MGPGGTSRVPSDGDAMSTNGAGAPACPACGSPDVVPIEYGFPTSDVFEAEEAGLLAIGGCEPMDEAHRCRTCQHDF